MDKDYKKLYEEALERARDLHDNHPLDQPQTWMTCEKIFPEFRESEDERIRKALIRNFTNQHSSNFPTTDGFTREQILAWLENQKDIETEDFGEFIDRLSKQFPEVSFAKLSRIAVRVKNWLEKQCEQKPFNYENANIQQKDFASKGEPKFKVGDWITNGACIIKITSVDDRYYLHDNDCVGGDIESIDKEYHLWTIQDAKDGDVLEFGDHGKLVVGIVSYVNKTTGKVDVNCLLENNNFKMGIYYNLDTIKPHPATKEQCDFLFQKMIKAGYEWDAEKKELKKIEQKNSCSEKDESWFKELELMALSFSNDDSYRKKFFEWLKSLKDRVQPQPKQEWSKENEEMFCSLKKLLNEASCYSCTEGSDKILDWLKSIKPNHWKPSEEQMQALNWIAYNYTLMDKGMEEKLQSLYKSLKNL